MEPAKDLTELRKGFVAAFRRNDLLSALTLHGRWICAMVPSELVIRNVLMMVSKLARDESFRIISGEPISAFDSLNKLWSKSEDNNESASGKKLKKGLIQAINEVSSEMSLCCENIAARAGDLINPQDVLIVHHLSESPTLAAFLASARATRKHRVLSVARSNEFDSTPEFATPIQLCDVGSKMCEVTKITPFFVTDPMMVNPNKAPGVGFSHALDFSGLVEVPRPTFDLLPASLVTLYISNSACILPSHVYRLIGDYYHPEDVTES
ncbi:initiation factor, subunit 2 family protein [Ancylostoma duodenale]|uniref:Initiation factor, subunit 2 family protein n=1 Tax=Ancylostoma duodenale TaxID=51022 RepID=A0A0C2G089_9BILA|nr:initiation factor, subunit 2 family protein [Ancylostoma duodenale]